MTLNAMTRLDILRKQNDLLNQQMQKLQSEHNDLLAQMQPPPQESFKVPTKPQTESENKSSEVIAADQLKEQMHLLAGILQAYAERYEGRYPSSLKTLIDFSNRNNFQQVVQNPYTGSRNPLVSEDVCLDITYDPADEGLSEHAGCLLYQAHFGAEEQVDGYTLAAFDQQGTLLKDELGEVLILNSFN